MNRLLSCMLMLSITATLADFPSSVKRCTHGDNACFTQSTQEVFKTLPGGLRELNLLPFDPLHIKSLALNRNPNSPVNVELKFKDLDLIGLKSAKITTVKGVDFNGRSELEAMVPVLVLKGKYQIDGRVLILPVVGNGDADIICKNLIFKYAFDLKPLEKDGQVYAELKHVKLDIKPAHVQFKFDNLFNGDKALGDNMNKFINENWREIFQEIEPTFTKALSLITKQMINNVFAKYPYETFFV